MSGIKPTRLWHLTSQKRFNSLIKDRESLGHPHNQRDKKDQFQLLAIVFGSALAFIYTYRTLGLPTTVDIVGTEPGAANDTTDNIDKIDHCHPER
ncbi:unnamed protein product [Plutella xylostella]|uniref:(diamondback moth) hypothetical protein n=1 Tax=Plutella xylostella TaxID=51655 RepID=A0A8S4EA71_PLUXY|nr:unnamed protein product [Plutella xylostella]